mmetsp:Transcript_22366/g.49519  ORF Transcript_22366/g.49519 Transcript_22366/m.49519 type:complete len:208 (+) Transcript_22366:360-983(+)
MASGSRPWTSRWAALPMGPRPGRRAARPGCNLARSSWRRRLRRLSTRRCSAGVTWRSLRLLRLSGISGSARQLLNLHHGLQRRKPLPLVDLQRQTRLRRARTSRQQSRQEVHLQTQRRTARSSLSRAFYARFLQAWRLAQQRKGGTPPLALAARAGRRAATDAEMGASAAAPAPAGQQLLWQAPRPLVLTMIELLRRQRQLQPSSSA